MVGHILVLHLNIRICVFYIHHYQKKVCVFIYTAFACAYTFMFVFAYFFFSFFYFPSDFQCVHNVTQIICHQNACMSFNLKCKHAFFYVWCELEGSCVLHFRTIELFNLISKYSIKSFIMKLRQTILW